MISFESDYITGAHPVILEKLYNTNLEQQSGYGNDKYTKSAKKKIKSACGLPTAEVELLVGGTQTNATIISTMLKDYEGVVSAITGHVNTHEAGAIEFTGHKVLTIENHDGKITVADLKKFLDKFYNDRNASHMVYPGMVYISHPTEYGTIYKKTELKEIYKICRKYDMTLFIDGARLGYGLMCDESDMTLKDIAKFSDVFYIGGTKVGALCGEAVVFAKNNKPHNFMPSIKRRGALLAKGRLLGVQFDTLFSNNLYFDISKHAVDMANELKKMLKRHGYKFFINSPTNQQFIIIDKKEALKLRKEVAFSVWEEYDKNNLIIRLATTWSTTKDDINKLETIINNIKNKK